MVVRIEDLLLQEGLLDERKLQEAIGLTKGKDCRLLEIIVELGYLTEEQVALALSRFTSFPYIPREKLTPLGDESLEELIPYDFAVKNQVLPLHRSLWALLVAVADPTDFLLADNIEKLSGCSVKVLVAAAGELKRAIKEFYE